MICSRNGCEVTEDVVRWSPGIYLCLFHREALKGSAKAGQQPRVNRDAEAHEAAVQACGPTPQPRYKPVKGKVWEISGGQFESNRSKH